MTEPRTPTPRPAGIWRLGHPAIGLSALACVILSIWFLPADWGLPVHAQDRLDRLLARPLHVPLGEGDVEVYIFRKRSVAGTSFEVINPNVESWDRLSLLTSKSPADLVRASYAGSGIRTGPWYPVWQVSRRTVNFQFLTSQAADTRFTNEEVAAARETYLNWLASPQGGGAPRAAALVAGGDRTDSGVVWSGVLADLGSLIAMGVFVVSLAGMPRHMRRRIEQARIRRGLCGICRYDLSAIESSAEGTRCPECGAVWEWVGRARRVPAAPEPAGRDKCGLRN